jgi:hypothetical protein
MKKQNKKRYDCKVEKKSTCCVMIRNQPCYTFAFCISDAFVFDKVSEKS